MTQIILGVLLVGAVLLLASKNGSKTAQLKRLQEELKRQTREQENASKIVSRVYGFDRGDIEQRLRNVARK